MTYALLPLLLGCGSNPGTPPAPPDDGDAVSSLTIVYQSRLDGEIEPCG